MSKEIVGKLKTMLIDDQSIIIENYECLRNPVLEKYYYTETFFKNKDWIYPIMLNREIIRFVVDGKIVVDARPYDHEF